MSVRYDNATGATGKPAKGTLEFYGILKLKFPTYNLSHVGIYARRKIRGSSSRYSLHAEGRAVDLTINIAEPAKSEARKIIREWCIANSEKYQIQEIIDYKNSQIWTSNRAKDGWRKYTGQGSGTLGHLHIGQNRIGAKLEGNIKFDKIETVKAEGAEIVQNIKENFTISTLIVVVTLYIIIGSLAVSIF